MGRGINCIYIESGAPRGTVRRDVAHRRVFQSSLLRSLATFHRYTKAKQGWIAYTKISASKLRFALLESGKSNFVNVHHYLSQLGLTAVQPLTLNVTEIPMITGQWCISYSAQGTPCKKDSSSLGARTCASRWITWRRGCCASITLP